MPIPCCAWSRLSQIRSRATRSGVCRAASRSSLVQRRAVRSKHGCALHPQPRAAPVGDGRPAHVGAVAVLLRPDVRRLELVDRRREAPDAGGAAGVRVRLARAAAEPLDAVERGREREPQAEPGQREGPVALGADVERQHQPLAGGRPGVGREQTAVPRRGADPRAHDERAGAGLDRDHPVAHAVQPVAAPRGLELVGPVQSRCRCRSAPARCRAGARRARGRPAGAARRSRVEPPGAEREVAVSARGSAPPGGRPARGGRRRSAPRTRPVPARSRPAPTPPRGPPAPTARRRPARRAP